ncbi:MAG: MotA/TolQ/ExbB proton channel family protein [Zoogloea sp.]|nr:MotA/TolQ/ExbB proton channel family protein [Zoogloea sp.]
MPQTQFGLAHLWGQGDILSHGVALILLAMSVASWYLILAKGWQMLRSKRAADAVEAFWSASSLEDGLFTLASRAPDAPSTVLAHRCAAASRHCETCLQGTLSESLDRSEFLTRALRQAISRSTAKLESGLTVLASIGSTAPFVGLFGTVWGIYHALLSIGTSGMATLDKVAGPVGEALIMTAAGLFVAIPAVLAYNTFTRANRIELSELDAFAHDLHAYFTTGARLAPASNVSELRRPARTSGPGAA